MSFTHEIMQKWSDGSRNIEKILSGTGNAQTSLSEAVPDESTDLLIALALDVSEIELIYIVSDEDVTLETNDGTTPDNTLALKADEPVIWHSASLHDNPFTTDITALYLTNASGAEATLQIEVVYDPTP